mmetsp:Transcript_18243/g.21059  ORF Transcript_18243/g.21059 Transcript_18243/m.21059 type:complete len:199 (+) Transcript_18243:141-737(+)
MITTQPELMHSYVPMKTPTNATHCQMQTQCLNGNDNSSTFSSESNNKNSEKQSIGVNHPFNPGNHHSRKVVRKMQEGLKYDKIDDRQYGSKMKKRLSSKLCSFNNKRRKKTISFVESVKIFPIPARDEYSKRVQQRIWSNADEIHQNAARNTVEFLSEGWNWRTVMEDEGMHLCVATGELIHPIHYENLGIKPGDLVP